MPGEKALVIHPKPDYRERLSSLLRKGGYQVDGVAGVDEALVLISENSYRLVLGDLPEKGGFVSQLERILPSALKIAVVDGFGLEVRERPQFILDIELVEKFLPLITLQLRKETDLSLEIVRLKDEVELSRKVKELTLIPGLDELTLKMLRFLVELVQAEGGLLVLFGKDEEDFLLKSWHGVFTEDPDYLSSALNKRKIRDVLNGDEMKLVKGKRLFEKGVFENDVSSLVFVPLVSAGFKIGGMILTRLAKEKEFNQEKLTRMSRVIPDLARALKNSLALSRVSELVLKDDVTNAYNRRFFERYIDEEIERCERYGLILSLIFIDLNNFKRVNELYGHAIGSKMLGAVASRIIRKVRSVDRVVRYGGDEFCVVLPGTAAEGAFRAAERIKERLESTPFVFPGTEPTYITAAFGIASYPRNGLNKRSLVNKADKAMFRAKKEKTEAIIIAED
jgi:two-component system cell cycle response regulator